MARRADSIDPTRLGRSAGHLTFEELRRVDAALRLVLDL
jgi:mRNA interferase MazF